MKVFNLFLINILIELHQKYNELLNAVGILQNINQQTF